MTEIAIERNLRIPMSDGVDLAADLYRPRGEGRSNPPPILSSRDVL